jgi:hypothetical protein
VALGKQATEDDVRPLLTPEAGAELDSRWEQAAARLQACEGDLRVGFERRGQLTQAQQTLAADRTAGARQLELSMIDERLHAAADRWRVLAMTGMVLESVRRGYERERQPECLRETSEFLSAMTGGQYRRVWTPLDENLLYVDHADGRSLSVEALSRGTREQLFLSLRLALVAAYARRGVELPLVLDDVFVNFDNERSKAAAAVLQDFADGGRQVFVFTCHEHILKLFKSRKATIIRLPERGEPAAVEAPTIEPPKPLEAPIEMLETSLMEEETPSATIVEPPPVEEPLPVFDQPIVEVAVSLAPASRVLLAEAPVIPPLEEEAVEAFDQWDWRDDTEAPAEEAVPWFEDAWQDESEAPADDGPLEDDWHWRVPEPEPVAVIAPPPPPPVEPPPVKRKRTRKLRYWGYFTGNGAEEFPGEFAERPGPGMYEVSPWDDEVVVPTEAWTTIRSLPDLDTGWERPAVAEQVIEVQRHDAASENGNGWHARVERQLPIDQHRTVDQHDGDYAPPRFELHEAANAGSLNFNGQPDDRPWPRPPHYLGANV